MYQNEVKCSVSDTEMIFHSHANKTHFYKKGSELGLILKVRQSAKIVVSDKPGLVDFAIGLVKSVFNLPDGQVMFFEEFELIQIQFWGIQIEFMLIVM